LTHDRIKQLGNFIYTCLPALIIILWIDAYVWLMREGRYKAFLQPDLFPLLIIGACVLLIFLIPFIFEGTVLKNGRPGKEMWARAAILCLPVIFLYATYGQSLGTDAFSKRKLDSNTGIETPVGAENNLLSDVRFDRPITLLDLVRNLDRVDGKQIITSGSVYRGSGVPDGHFMLFQFVISCCAADAQPIWVLVKYSRSSALANESWVRVEGKVVFEQYKENRVPVIEANALHPLPEPPVEECYLYF